MNQKPVQESKQPLPQSLTSEVRQEPPQAESAFTHFLHSHDVGWALAAVAGVAGLVWLVRWLKPRRRPAVPRAADYAPLQVLCGNRKTGAFDNSASRYILSASWDEDSGVKSALSGKPVFYGHRTDKHLLTIAPTRTGKGRGLILPNLLDLPDHSVFVIDPKGENALVSAPYRQAEGHEIVIFNPYGIYADEFKARGFAQFQSFNPLKNLDPDSQTFADDAAAIAEALIYDTGGDSHWTDGARGFVEFLIMYLVTAPEEQETCTFRRLREIIAGGYPLLNGTKKNNYEDGLFDKASKSDCHLVWENVGRYANDDAEVRSIIATAETQTRMFKSDVLCAALDGEGFDFGRMKNRKTSVYLILPSERLITQARYLRLVLLVAMSQFMRSEKGKYQVVCLLAEFANLGALQVIENGYGLIAGHGVALWSFVQNLTQLQNLYKNNWEVFIANSAAVTVSNVNDVATAEYFSKRAGRQEVQKTAFSMGRSEGDWELFRSSSNSSANTQWVWEDSLPVSSLYNADPEKLFLFLEGRAEPVQCRKLRYDRDEPFKGRASGNPMHKS